MARHRIISHLEGRLEETALWLFESENVDVATVVAENQVGLGVGPIRMRPVVQAVRHERKRVQVVLR